jgi:Putative transposase
MSPFPLPVVFTLPQEVAELVTSAPTSDNAKVVYNLLFQAASATLREVAANPKRLGAQIGVLAVLHTWGQNLHHHPHLHCVVTGGGLSCDERGRTDRAPHWRSCRPGFFLPVRVLSRVFRGKFRDGLRQAFAQGALTFAGRLASLAESAAFASWLTPLCHKDWVVYAKPPFGGPAQVLKYLARYTHRVAISNARLVALEEDGTVVFRAKDYQGGGTSKVVRLSAEEFLRRFSQHLLPKGFVKIRHYGLLANHGRTERLHLCRRLLLPALLLTAATLLPAPADAIAPALPPTCPKCGGVRLECRELPKCHSAAMAASAAASAAEAAAEASFPSPDSVSPGGRGAMVASDTS